VRTGLALDESVSGDLRRGKSNILYKSCQKYFIDQRITKDTAHYGTKKNFAKWVALQSSSGIPR